MKNTRTVMIFFTLTLIANILCHITAQASNTKIKQKEKQPEQVYKEINKKTKNDTITNKIMDRATEEIKQSTIQFNFTLLELKSIKNISAALKCHYKVSPSYLDNLYSRIDSCDLNLGDSISGQLSKLTQLPFGISFGASTGLTFIRQFKSKFRALRALPYSLINIPISANQAIHKLNPGDFVKFPVSLNLSLSRNLFSQVFGITSLSANTGYVLSGNFQMHLYRMKQNKVRVKLIGIANQNAYLNANVNLGFTIFQTSIAQQYIGNKIKNQFVGLSPFQYSASIAKNKIFMIDFIYDLNDINARAAFNNLIKAKMIIDLPLLLNPSLSRHYLRNKFLVNLDDSEKIYQEDKYLPANERRVDRPFRGDISSFSSQSNLKVGFNFASFFLNNSYSQNFISYRNKQNKLENYFFPNLSSSNGASFLLGLYERKLIKNAYSIMKTDDNYKISKFDRLGINIELQDVNFSNNEFEEHKKFVKNNLPLSLFNKINWQDWNDNKTKTNARIILDISFTRQALLKMKGMSKDQLKEQFLNYMRDEKIEISEYDKYFAPFKISRKMQHILNYKTKSDLILVFNNFAKILKTSTFQKFGIGFFLYLLRDDLEKTVNINFSWQANDYQSIVLKYPEVQDEQAKFIYDNIKYVQQIIHNDAFDYRFFEEKATNTLIKK